MSEQEDMPHAHEAHDSDSVSVPRYLLEQLTQQAQDLGSEVTQLQRKINGLQEQLAGLACGEAVAPPIDEAQALTREMRIIRFPRPIDVSLAEAEGHDVDAMAELINGWDEITQPYLLGAQDHLPQTLRPKTFLPRPEPFQLSGRRHKKAKEELEEWKKTYLDTTEWKMETDIVEYGYAVRSLREPSGDRPEAFTYGVTELVRDLDISDEELFRISMSFSALHVTSVGITWTKNLSFQESLLKTLEARLPDAASFLERLQTYAGAKNYTSLGLDPENGTAYCDKAGKLVTYNAVSGKFIRDLHAESLEVSRQEFLDLANDIVKCIELDPKRFVS